jgi:hypothetical protein
MDANTLGHGFLELILARTVLLFSRLSPNIMSRSPRSRVGFLFAIKIFAFDLHSSWNFQGPSRNGSASFEANSPQNLESDITIEPSIYEAKASRFCGNFSIILVLPAISRNRSLDLLISPLIPPLFYSSSPHFSMWHSRVSLNHMRPAT